MNTNPQPYNHATTLNDVSDERRRQLRLKEQGRFAYTPSEVSDLPALAMLMEEVGEVSRNTLSRANLVQDGSSDDLALYTELVQVAAVALAWAERLVPNI